MTPGLTITHSEAGASADRPWFDRRAELPCPIRKPSINVQQLDDEAVLFDPENASTFRLNATALLVWNACTPGRTIAGVVRQFHETWGIELDHARDDVEQLVAFFAANGLVQ